MNTKKIKQEIISTIAPLWKKEPNTLYALRIVLPQFGHPVGLFFEWNKINRATHSRAIASYPVKQAEEVVAASEEIKKETGLTIVIMK